MTADSAALLAMVASYVRISQFEEPAPVPGASLLEIQKLSTGAKAQPHHPHARRRGQGRRVDRDALRLIGSWSDRKSRLFTEAHVGKAINRLEELGWAGK